MGRKRRSVVGGRGRGDTNTTRDWKEEWLPRGEDGEEEGKGTATGSDKLVFIRTEKRDARGDTDGVGYGFEWWVDKGDKPEEEEVDVATTGDRAVVDNVRWTYGKLSRALYEMPSDVPYGATSVALGSRIYVLGGVETTGFLCSRRDLTSVFSSDVARPKEGWEKGDLNTPRVFSCPLILDGKLWVFGGSSIESGKNRDRGFPFAEVLDPALGKWKSWLRLPPRDDLFVSPCLHQALPLRHRNVLLHEFDSLLGYDLETGSLFPFDLSFGFEPKSTHVSAIFDNILYCYRNREGLFGYDLVRKQWYPSPVSGLTRGSVLPKQDDFPTSLLHLGGGRLCVIWCGMVLLQGGSNPGQKLMIRSTVFTVSKDTSGKEPLLRASIEAAKYYYMEANWLVDCVALSPGGYGYEVGASFYLQDCDAFGSVKLWKASKKIIVSACDVRAVE